MMDESVAVVDAVPERGLNVRVLDVVLAVLGEVDAVDEVPNTELAPLVVEEIEEPVTDDPGEAVLVIVELKTVVLVGLKTPVYDDAEVGAEQTLVSQHGRLLSVLDPKTPE